MKNAPCRAHLKFFRLSEPSSLTPCFSWVLSQGRATLNSFNGFHRPPDANRRAGKRNLSYARPFLFALGVALSLPLAGCKKSAPAQSSSGATPSDPAIKSDEPVSLQPKWISGNRYVQHMDMEQNMELSMPQMPKPMKQETTMGQDYSVTVASERPGGGRDLELEILSVQMDVSRGGSPVMAFDSKGESLDDSKNPIASIFRALIGTRLKFALNASNRVEKIEGVKELNDRVAASAPAQTRGMLQGMLNEDYFRQMIDYSKYLPSQPVKPGDTWTTHPEIPTGPFGTLVMDLDYTFKGWEKHEKRDCALLEFSGPLKTKGEPGAGMMGMKMSLDGGNTTGKSWFDPQLGVMIEVAMDMKMNLRIGLPAQGAAANNPAAQPQTMTAPLNQKITVKLVEVVQAGK